VVSEPAEGQSGEKQRQQDLSSFMEKQSLRMVDQEHDWKQTKEKFDQFTVKFALYEQRMAELSVISQSLTKSQENFDDVNERLERRIHEITEMQRLASEHMRQDWEAFQGGDQKRWTSMMIKEEERQNDLDRILLQISERTDALEHGTQTLTDLINSIKEARVHRTQALLDLLGNDLKEIS